MQEQKTASGNQNHGVWVCNKCGWTYPNPHPSAKHRRNHKRHCGKLGDSETTGSPKQDRPSSPDSEQDLPAEQHGSAVKKHAGALKGEVSDRSPHGSSVAENAGAESGETSGRFEEEVFEDAATEFSVSLPSPKGEFIQLIDSDLSDADSGSGERAIRHGHGSVAIERGTAASSGEEKTEQKPVILSDPVQPSRRKTSHESFETKRREDFVGFTVHSNNGDAETDHRSNGIACILKPDLSKNEAFVHIDNAGAVDNMNTNVQEYAMETQNRQILEAEAELSKGKTLSPDHALCAIKRALEVKGENTPVLLLSEAPKVQTEHYSSDGHLEGSSDETCEKIKGLKKGEAIFESYRNCQSKMNVNKNSACHGCERNIMLYDPDASAEWKGSLKNNAVHSEYPSPKTCSDTIGELLSQSYSPTLSSAADRAHTTGSFSGVMRSVDISVPVKPEIEKTGLESGKSDINNGYQHHGSKDQDSSSPLMSTEESLGNFTSISSEILNLRIEESLKKVECNANIFRENSIFKDKDVLTPLETLNPGKYLEASDVHEILSLDKQKVSLSFTGTGTQVQTDGHTQSAVPYLNGTHSASSPPFKEAEYLIPEQEVKDRDSNDKYGSIVLHLQASSVHSDVTIQSESVFTGNNTQMEHEEHSPPAALSEYSDFHVQEKLHKELESDQNYLNGMPMQADIQVSDTVLDNSKYEKSTSDGLKVELLQNEENLVAYNDYLKTRTVEKTDSLSTTDQTTEQENSAVEDDTLQISEHGSQAEGKREKEESSGGDNSKMSAVCEPRENGSDSDIFQPHSLVILVEPSRDYTRRTIHSDSTEEPVLQTTTTSNSDYAGSHSPSTLVNDSEERANDEIVDKAMSLEKARTPLKSLLVESTEENTDDQCHKGTTVGHPKSPSTTTENLSDDKVKTSELPSYKVYQSQSIGNRTPTYAAKIRLNSPAWILGNKREKQKSRGVYSWIACVCCSSMN